MKKRQKKANHESAYSNVMEVLDAVNWIQWQVRLGASFIARVFFKDGPDQGHAHANVKTKKAIPKKAITESTVTPTYGGLRRSKLDAVASSTRSIFLCEVVVQGRYKSGESARQFENLNSLKKANH